MRIQTISSASSNSFSFLYNITISFNRQISERRGTAHDESIKTAHGRVPLHRQQRGAALREQAGHARRAL